MTVARDGLEHEDVALVLPYVPADAEAEVNSAYDRTVKARASGGEARDVVDLWFCETVVRLHRAGEGASYTGLKPAGLDVGPVIPIAEQAIADEDPAALVDVLTGIVRDETTRRFQEMLDRKQTSGEGVDAARRYVTAMLGLQVWAHELAGAARNDAHGEGHEHHA